MLSAASPYAWADTWVGLIQDTSRSTAGALGCFRQLEHPSAGRFETVAPPFRIEGEKLGGTRAGPVLHAEARQILREAGLDEDAIEELA